MWTSARVSRHDSSLIEKKDVLVAAVQCFIVKISDFIVKNYCSFIAYCKLNFVQFGYVFRQQLQN